MSEREPKKGSIEYALEAAAKAMFDAHVQSLLQRIAERTFNIEELKEYFLGLTKETERALAVLSFSYTDACLCDLMLSHMNPDIPGGAKSLFDTNGPFGSASARIKGCAALYWIRPRTFKNLDLARKIRNEFAHNPKATSLGHPRISGLLASMVPTEEAGLKALKLSAEPSLRLRFHMRCIGVCCDTITDLLGRPEAIRMGLPADAAHPPWEKLPEPIRNVHRAMAEVQVQLLDGEGIKIEGSKEKQ